MEIDRKLVSRHQYRGAVPIEVRYTCSLVSTINFFLNRFIMKRVYAYHWHVEIEHCNFYFKQNMKAMVNLSYMVANRPSEFFRAVRQWSRE